MACLSDRHQVVILSEITRYAAVSIELYQKILLSFKGDINFGISIIKAVRHIHIDGCFLIRKFCQLINIYPSEPIQSKDVLALINRRIFITSVTRRF